MNAAIWIKGRLLLIWGFAFLGIVEVFAQKIEVGAGIGVLNYTGDIAASLNPRFFRPGGELFFRYNLKNGLSFRAGVLGGMITADDAYADNDFQQQRALSFKSLILAGDLRAEYNFLDYREVRHAVNWTPYVFGGIGYHYFNPSPNSGSYSQTGVVLPFGVGVKYQIRRPWSVGLEFGARKTFTDYLDNFGGEEIAPVKLENGNPALKDMYYYLGLSVSYTFYKIVCP